MSTFISNNSFENAESGVNLDTHCTNGCQHRVPPYIPNACRLIWQVQLGGPPSECQPTHGMDHPQAERHRNLTTAAYRVNQANQYSSHNSFWIVGQCFGNVVRNRANIKISTALKYTRCGSLRVQATCDSYDRLQIVRDTTKIQVPTTNNGYRDHNSVPYVTSGPNLQNAERWSSCCSILSDS